jgi:hypothetical protein
MIVYKEIKVKEVNYKICDKCGKKCETTHPDMLDHRLHWETGYGSKYDCSSQRDTFNIDLCDECFDKYAKPLFQ